MVLFLLVFVVTAFLVGTMQAPDDLEFSKGPSFHFELSVGNQGTVNVFTAPSLSYTQAMLHLSEDTEEGSKFRSYLTRTLAECPFNAFFFEAIAVTTFTTSSRMFKFALVDSPDLAGVKTVRRHASSMSIQVPTCHQRSLTSPRLFLLRPQGDPEAFSEHFPCETGGTGGALSQAWRRPGNRHTLWSENCFVSSFTYSSAAASLSAKLSCVPTWFVFLRQWSHLRTSVAMRGLSPLARWETWLPTRTSQRSCATRRGSRWVGYFPTRRADEAACMHARCLPLHAFLNVTFAGGQLLAGCGKDHARPHESS